VTASRRRCDGLEVALARKADVAALAELEAAAAVVSEERERLTSLTQGLARGDSRISALEDGLRGEIARGEAVAGVLESLGSGLRARATNSQLAELSESLESMRREAGEALVQRTAESARQLSALQEQLERLTGQTADTRDVAEATVAAVEKLSAEMQSMARAEQVLSLERGATLEAAVTALRRAVDARASKESTDTMAKALGACESKVRLLEAQVSVALEFVDWYAAKGEAMEHNASVIEDRLAEMAAAGARSVAASQAARKALA
jgi:phosphohistidine swiveling domain-containing protein